MKRPPSIIEVASMAACATNSSTRRYSDRSRTRVPSSQLGAPTTIPPVRTRGSRWLTPQAYAATRRSAALRSVDGSAPRTVTSTAQEGIRPTPVAIG